MKPRIVMSWPARVWGNPAYRFVLLFALLLGVMVVAYPILTKRWFVVVDTLTVWTAHMEYYMLRPFTSAVSAFPPDIHPKSIPSVGFKHGRFVPEWIIIYIILKNIIVITPSMTDNFS